MLHLNQYHLKRLDRLKELSPELHHELHQPVQNHESRDDIEEGQETQAHKIYRAILANETSEPANLIALAKMLAGKYGLEEALFIRKVFENTCRAFRLLK